MPSLLDSHCLSPVSQGLSMGVHSLPSHCTGGKTEFGEGQAWDWGPWWVCGFFLLPTPPPGTFQASLADWDTEAPGWVSTVCLGHDSGLELPRQG